MIADRGRWRLIALVLLLEGCATMWSLPKPMGGVRAHAGFAVREQQMGDPCSAGLWWMLCWIMIPDMALSLVLDVLARSRRSVRA